MSVRIKDIDRGFKRIMREIEKLDKKPYVKIGFPRKSKESKEKKESKGSAEPEGEGESDTEFVTVLDVAIWLEFGTIHMEQRPFVRGSFDANVNKYNKMTAKLLGDIYAGRTTVEKALDKLGLTIQNDIKSFIREGKVRPESLRALLQGGTTLWDTGQLVNSITYIKVMR